MLLLWWRLLILLLVILLLGRVVLLLLVMVLLLRRTLITAVALLWRGSPLSWRRRAPLSRWGTIPSLMVVMTTWTVTLPWIHAVVGVGPASFCERGRMCITISRVAIEGIRVVAESDAPSMLG